MATAAVSALLLLLLVVAFQSDGVESVTTTVVAEIEEALDDFLGHDVVNGAVRLIFHDSAGVNGIDGCIDFTDEANAGLEELVAQMEEVYEPFMEDVSRADFWTKAGQMGVNDGIRRRNKRECPGGEEECKIPALTAMQWGREDCATSPDAVEVTPLPSPTTTRDEYNTFFANQYGLDANGVVALLGVHSLGRCNEDNSGLEGKFDRGNHYELNNHIYRVLDNTHDLLTFKQKERTDDHYQIDVMYDNVNTGLLLYSDLGMMFEFGLENGVGPTDCEPFVDCAESGTADMVRQYAEDEANWFEEFDAAWKIMIDVKYDSLADPVDA